MFTDKNASTVQREFQKGLDTDQRRRSREEERLLLRKRQRAQILKKRRVALKSTESGRNYEPGDLDEDFDNVHQIDKLSQQLLNQLDDYVKGCQMDHVDTNYECCTRIRRLLSIEKNPPIDQIIRTGIVPRLVEFCKSNSERLQFEASWALTNIASGKPEHTACIIRSNAIPAFVHLVETTTNEAVFEQALWALGNISGDSAECRNLVLEAGGLDKLIPRLQTLNNVSDKKQASVLRTACWTLSNFCRGKPPPPRAMIEKCIPTLIPFLMSADDEILQDAAWAFSYLSDTDYDDDPNWIGSDMKDEERIDLIQQSGALPKLVNLLGHQSPHVQHPILRCIGNMVTGTSEQTQRVVNCGLLKKLVPLLESPIPTIKKETCWAISNITATNEDHVEQVIQANLIQPLIHLLKNEGTVIQKEAAWALANATSAGNAKQIRFLANQGLVPGLVKVLRQTHHAPTLMVALEGLKNICQLGEKEKELNGGVNVCARFVEDAKGVDVLEELQTRNVSDKIIDKAEEILRDFFEGEEKMLDTNDNDMDNTNSEDPFKFDINTNTNNEGMNFQNDNNMDTLKF